MIKRILCLAFFIVLCVTVSLAFAVNSRGSGTEAMVTALQGTAKAFSQGSSAGREVKKGDHLGRDQEIRVGDRSRIELRFPDGTVMRLSEGSQLTMNQILYSAKTEHTNVRVNLGMGKLWAKVKKLMTTDSAVEVRTINAVAGVRGTVYRVSVAEDSSATIKVYDGSVYVANPPKGPSVPSEPTGTPHAVAGPQEVAPPYHEVSMEEWTTIVKAMQQISISPQGVPSKPESFDTTADEDDWVRWNQERDRQPHF